MGCTLCSGNRSSSSSLPGWFDEDPPLPSETPLAGM
jgi:hypothetical protein